MLLTDINWRVEMTQMCAGISFCTQIFPMTPARLSISLFSSYLFFFFFSLHTFIHHLPLFFSFIQLLCLSGSHSFSHPSVNAVRWQASVRASTSNYICIIETTGFNQLSLFRSLSLSVCCYLFSYLDINLLFY